MPGSDASGVEIPNPLGVYFPSYTPEPGLYGSLSIWSNGSAMIGSNTGCLLDWLAKDGNSTVCFSAGTFSPGGYVYTDPYGRVYTISASGGLQSVQDVAGNAITITPNGITSTNGLNVPFVRDAQNRITQITDPLGHAYNYAYDSSGNLASVTYPGVATPASIPTTPATYTSVAPTRAATASHHHLRFARPPAHLIHLPSSGHHLPDLV